MTAPAAGPGGRRAWDGADVEQVVRDAAPRVLGTLLARHGRFDACEDAVQEALLAASVQWRSEGVPDHPVGWLTTVASRRLVDGWRSASARDRRETEAAAASTARPSSAPAADEHVPERDDTLDLMFLCCSPALTPESQVALTLRAVGGLSTAQVAAAFLVPEAAMTRRISRAKQRIAEAGLGSLTPAERGERLVAVLHVLYLTFNEGYTATAGPELHRVDLTTEALRLTRHLHRLLPDDGEVTGLLALMLLTDARRPARTAPDGALVPLAAQDRTRWDSSQITEGIELLERSLPRSLVGPYQVQASIAAVHAEAARSEDTDWAQVAALYELLERLAPSSVVRVNRAVAVAMTDGPAAGLRLLDTVADDRRSRASHRLGATRAHLLEMAGELDAARSCYEDAARRTTSAPEQRYLSDQAARLQTRQP